METSPSSQIGRASSLPCLFVAAGKPRALWALAAMTLLFGAAMLPAMVTMADHGASVIAFESAGSVSRSQEILAGWGNAGKAAAWWQLVLDTPFLIGYGLFLAGACAAVARRAQQAGRPRLRRAAAIVVWFGPLAATADFLQNISLALVLAGHKTQPWPRISALAAPLTTSLGILAALFALAGVFATRGRFRPPRFDQTWSLGKCQRRGEISPSIVSGWGRRMAQGKTNGGAPYDPLKLDEVEQRFWRGIWESASSGTAAERGVELRRFGPIQASVVADLPQARMLNLVLGATEPGAVEDGDLAAALGWAESRGVEPYVPVQPGTAASSAAEALLSDRGYRPGYAWMKFVRDSHPPRFAKPGVEVAELREGEDEPFGMIAATGFGLPAWASAFFADLPGRPGWHCYVARVDGRAQACAAMFIHNGIAEFGVAATLEPARGCGCQLALLHRRIVDAVAAGCHTLFVETGEQTPDRPSGSYRNILRAGFEEAYVRPNWQPADR